MTKEQQEKAKASYSVRDAVQMTRAEPLRYTSRESLLLSRVGA